MALDERADALSTVDADDADTAFSPRAPLAEVPLAEVPVEPDVDDVAGTHENGASSGNRNGSASPDTTEAPGADATWTTEPPADRPALVVTNGTSPADSSPGRAARKRTARQRTLLMAEGTGTAIGPEPDALDDDPSPVDPLLVPGSRAGAEAGAAPLESPTTGPVSVLPASTTAAAAAAAALYAPAPPRTAPVPVVAPFPTLAPAGDQTDVVEAVPAPPTVAPVPPPPKPRRRARPRVRKVTRIVRSVDAWSVFKVALIFFLAMGVVLMTASVLLWNLAQSTGTLDNVEGFFREAFNYDTFKLESEPLFRAALTLTALFVVAGTGLTVVMAVLFNLISDLTGGIRLTVLEREVIAREDQRAKRRRRKRPRAPRPARPPAAPVDGSPDGMPPAPSVKA